MVHRRDDTPMLKREPRPSANCRPLQRERVVRSRGYLASDRDGMPLFQKKIRAVADGGFEWRCMPLSPTVQQAGPAGLTPSRLLSAVEVAYSPASQAYRGLSAPTWHPVMTMAPMPVRLPMYQHSHGEGFGTKEVGTNRKHLLVGNRTGPLGETRSMIVSREEWHANVSVLPLRVRYKTLPADTESDWISKMEAACDV